MSGDVSTAPGLPTPGHADFEELAVGYALDALEPAEEDRFLVHLPACDRCARALEQHREVAARLAYALAASPAPRVSPELAAAFASEPGALPEDPFGAGAAAAVRPTFAAAPPATLRLNTSGRRARLLVGAGALGLALIAAVTVVETARTGPGPGPQSEQVASAAALAAVNDPAATVGRLVSTDGSDGHGVAVISNGRAWLVVDGLKSTAPGTRYVAWQQHGDSMVALASFQVQHASGATPVSLGPVAAADRENPTFAVSLEAAGAALPVRPSTKSVLQAAPPSTHPPS